MISLEEQARPFSFTGSGQTGVLLLHGFSGGPGRVLPLGRALADAGLDVEGPLLAGHGDRFARLHEVERGAWIRDAEAAYAALALRCRRVVAGGLSMGGALALLLAARRPEIRAVFTINHALALQSGWRLALIPIARFFIRQVGSGESDLNNPDVRLETCTSVPLNAIHQLQRLMTEVRRELPRVRQPVLFFRSRQDHVVAESGLWMAWDGVSSPDKEIVWLENSYHVATMDLDRDLIAEKALAFIREKAEEPAQ